MIRAAGSINAAGSAGAADAYSAVQGISTAASAADAVSAAETASFSYAVGTADIIHTIGAAGMAADVDAAGIAAAVGAAAGVCALELYRRMPAKWMCEAGEEVREAHMPHMRRHGRAAGIGCAAAVTLLLLKTIFFGTFVPAAAALSIFVLIVLAAAAQCDIQYQIIPDQASVFLLAAGLLRAVFSPHSPVLSALSESISGSAAGFLTMLFCAVLSRLLCRREGVGMGDVKLIGACGALVGINQIFYLILISSLTGAVFTACAILLRRSDIYSTYPMAPWIFLGTSICFIIG